MTRPGSILLSSDDGPEAHGLDVFKYRLTESGLAPVVVPSESAVPGTGTAAGTPDGKLTCAGIVVDAAHRMSPDIVLVGVNEGPNVWPAAIHSGTLGGLLAAVSLGVSAIAVSLDDVYSVPDDTAPARWASASLACKVIADILPELGRGLFGVSINVPSLDPGLVTGAVVATPPARPGGLSSETRLLRARHISLLPLASPYAGVRCASLAVARHLRAALERDGFG
jgi:broad specificity polyphosphatase/5'/3'-nucleotidase SurE